MDKKIDPSNNIDSRDNQKTVFYLWMSWNLKRIEDYLEKMASEGWVLKETSMSHTILKFQKGKPIKMKFCLDFQAQLPGDYKSVLEADGWNLLGDSNGWLLWMKAYEGEQPTFESDKLSLKSKSRRNLMYIAAILVTQIPMFKVVSREFSSINSVLGNIPMLMYVVIIAILCYAGFKLYKEGTK